MKKSFQFRIYPNKNQEVKLNRTLSTCRHLYNDSLAERKRESELNELKRTFGVFPWGRLEWLNYYDQADELTETKTPYQKEVFSQVLQNVLKRVDRSFKNFYNGFGYPRFQGRNRYNSFTYPQSGFGLEDGKLNLSKIGNIRIILHRGIEGKIKTCTIKKDIDQWYVTFSCEIDKPVLPAEIKEPIGIDVGLKSLLTLSSGEQIEPHEFLRESEKKLIHEQKRLSRKKKGSQNRNKHRIIVARVHRTIRNQRKDFAHKTSRMLVNKYDYIVFEDLQIKNMVQNHHLAKSISDAGWSQLINFTKSKAEYAGKIVDLVNPKNTSQSCSGCGNSVPKTLSVRTHSCPFCGLELDRDHNAAINILRISRSTAGTAGINACQGSLNRGSMQQEAPTLQGGVVHPTHLIYQALGKPYVEMEPCKGICAFCGAEIHEGIKLENTVSDTFTNYDLLTDRTASYVCVACNACVREPKLRRMNFIATERGITYFKRDEIELYLFSPPQLPFVFAVSESFKKHNSFKARVNYSQKLFYVQKEDEHILFSPNKYKEIYNAMHRLYNTFSKTALQTGDYQQNFIQKYGFQNFMRDEEIIKNARGTQQFSLLIYALNMSAEQLNKFKERKAKQEAKKDGM